MLESLIFWSLSIWFGFYLLNYSEALEYVRGHLLPRLPRILQNLLSCAFCTAFWIMVAFSLFTGFTPLVLAVPSLTMFCNLLYLNLRKVCDE